MVKGEKFLTKKGGKLSIKMSWKKDKNTRKIWFDTLGWS